MRVDIKQQQSRQKTKDEKMRIFTQIHSKQLERKLIFFVCLMLEEKRFSETIQFFVLLF